jgi:hypothetical protein
MSMIGKANGVCGRQFPPKESRGKRTLAKELRSWAVGLARRLEALLYFNFD